VKVLVLEAGRCTKTTSVEKRKGKPVIAITMGDAAGIGPEIIVKTISDESVWHSCYPLIIGDSKVMNKVCKLIGANICFQSVKNVSEATFCYPQIDLLCPEDLNIDGISWGQVDPAMGRAAALCLQTAFELAMDGEIHGVVSAPLNKEAFHRAGYSYADELSYLTYLTRSQETFILGAMGSIWTVAVTGHIPFRRIADRIKKDRIIWYVNKMNDVLKMVGFTKPRIAVAALNVHAGEGGLFGREEINEIKPAIQEMRAQGIEAEGPVPGDAVFPRALAGDFDGVVCMYHDQANIARKLQPRREGATIFMGLPVVCGTTAHGTAFDIAGKGIADPGSLKAALKYTVRLSNFGTQ
jgi:4-hydroxythreonine-4-phosphate dehydrogenase